MGYPMTWKRVINRNGLADGDYTNPPQRHAKNVNISDKGLATEEEFHEYLWPHVTQRITEYENSYRSLAGDIRRLERDTLDEQAICSRIVHQTEIDSDTVAAVLKAYMEI